MSSEEPVHGSLMKVIPTLGKGTLGNWWFHLQWGGRTQSWHKAVTAVKLGHE
jgi:hypothetical protein